MFLIVFALQEGQSGGWAPWIWAVLVAGVGFMTGFIYWQSVNTQEPLVPLDIFRDRDFSLSNVGVAVIGFAVTAMILPLMFYAQAVCGLSPTRSALLTAPMAITSGFLAPVVGKIVDRAHPMPVIGFGFSMLAIGLTWLSIAMTASAPIWELVLPFIALGVGMAFIWAPLAATATRSLPTGVAGASSGVYNATRQVGAVLGSAGMASFMTSRISSKLPPLPEGPAFGPQGSKGAALQLPEFLREPFAAAMSQSMLLPAFVALFGVAAALFMVGFGGSAGGDDRGARDAAADSTDNPGVPTRRVRVRPSAAEGFGGVDGALMASAKASTMTTITWSTRCRPRPQLRPGRPARWCGRPLGGMPMRTEPNRWPSAPSIRDRRRPRTGTVHRPNRGTACSMMLIPRQMLSQSDSPTTASTWTTNSVSGRSRNSSRGTTAASTMTNRSSMTSTHTAGQATVRRVHVMRGPEASSVTVTTGHPATGTTETISTRARDTDGTRLPTRSRSTRGGYALTVPRRQRQSGPGTRRAPPHPQARRAGIRSTSRPVRSRPHTAPG